MDDGDDGWGFTADDEAELADIVAAARLSGMITGTARFSRAILAAGYRRTEPPSPRWELRDEFRGRGGTVDIGPCDHVSSLEYKTWGDLGVCWRSWDRCAHGGPHVCMSARAVPHVCRCVHCGRGAYDQPP